MMNTKLEQKLKELPKTPGVYIYRNDINRVIYVGKAVNLKNRVNSYFQNKDHDPKTQELVKNIATLEWLEVGSEFEALIVEADFIKRYKPKYNIRLRDDKNYTYIKISNEDYPRVSTVHQITDGGAKHLGPFTEAVAVKSILKLVRHIYPYCTCAKKEDETCLYFHIGLCPGHGPKYISKADYAKNIKGIEAIFTGKTKKLEESFKKEMARAAKENKFEEAANWRDKLFYIKKIEHSHFISERDLAADVALVQLKKALRLPNIPARIECYDNSNILGTAAVGSMVVFKNGISSPKDYRRFQIKTVKGADDFATMAEVLKRRFSRAVIASGTRQSKPDTSFSELPDLVILDGGKGQLSAVLSRVEIPDGVAVVALAKRLEQIVKADNDNGQMPNTKSISNFKFQIINLPEQSEGMFLIQRIRDEAHRFAVSYHRKLKGKELFETSLDSIIGVGPKTKKKLISHFGSIKKIKEATIEELSAIVGTSTAQKIKEGLE
jgi:excinuclease ABC subunit C